MTDADNKDTSVDQTQSSSTGSAKLESELAQVRAMLEEQNRQFQAQQEALAAMAAQSKPTIVAEPDDIYEPQKLLNKSAEIMKQMMQQEKAKDLAIYNLAQDYPEIQTSSDVRKAVLDEQKRLPKSLQDTAEGYEMAVLKAVSRHGLVPKSRRQTVDEDVSVGNSGGSSRSERGSNRKNKVSENTLAVAQLLRGRELSAEEVKRLEETSKRDAWGRYK